MAQNLGMVTVAGLFLRVVVQFTGDRLLLLVDRAPTTVTPRVVYLIYYLINCYRRAAITHLACRDDDVRAGGPRPGCTGPRRRRTPGPATAGSGGRRTGRAPWAGDLVRLGGARGVAGRASGGRGLLCARRAAGGGPGCRPWRGSRAFDGVVGRYVLSDDRY